ncbi:unnamed protein product [Spodoptera littoralis]|uniref:Uncharacterized protein n=1 Tax=Spodoptera littoralis TaxID=7109 RepID=A0A9P0IHB4_SPOLI|nr:unnamed protein product [Spodoptera littoralis]CAH1647326.1 unnamed protein product [Spodoptera littoralis]
MARLSPFAGEAGFILEMSRGPGLGHFFLFGGCSLSVCLSTCRRYQYETRWRCLTPGIRRGIKIMSDFYFIEQSCFIRNMADGVLSVEVIFLLDLNN